MNGDGPSAHLCDPHVPGDLILGIPREQGERADILIATGPESGLPGLESVRQRARLDEIAPGREGESEPGPTPEIDGQYDFRLLEVLEGEEQIAATSLIQLYSQSATDLPPAGPGVQGAIAQPNHLLGFDTGPGATALAPDHERYLRELGILGPPPYTARPRVRVIDSGCNAPVDLQVRRNLLDPGEPTIVLDDHGHGTIITEIIHSITYGPFEIFKVADVRRQPTEWEVLQALSVAPVPPIMNLSMSLAFGHPYCARCGRRPVGARTGVFQQRLRELQETGTLVVVAAGNQGDARLAYPSRFASAVAVQAYAGAPPAPADYSNTGAADEAGNPHQGVFVCPGGSADGSEGPTLNRAGELTHGTSFAAAYMTGVLARIWAEHASCSDRCGTCSQAVLRQARLASIKALSSYSPALHGNGLAHLP